jgi:hypothetical protein
MKFPFIEQRSEIVKLEITRLGGARRDQGGEDLGSVCGVEILHVFQSALQGVKRRVRILGI